MKRLIKVEVWDCTCERCGYRWQSASKELPLCCARCKNVRWDKERVRLPKEPKKLKAPKSDTL